MNSVSMMGRICTELELKQGSKVPFCSFLLAVPRDGKKEETDFVPCISFGKQAEFLTNYFHKGSRLALIGKIRVEEYTSKDGDKKKNFSIVTTNIFFCESRQQGQTNEKYQTTTDPFASDEDLGTDMDVPF